MPYVRIDGDAWIEPFRPDPSQPTDMYLIMGRLHGDEFVLYGPLDTPAEAEQALMRLQKWALARMTG